MGVAPDPLDQQAAAVDAQREALDLVGAAGRQAGGRQLAGRGLAADRRRRAEESAYA